uniref:CUE domain-containing protein n=2 Tax=Triticum urartu TaxID=4572 RepID=A0A8R7K0T6_TRIUA
MGDHMTVFRSLRELFPQVDPRMLKAVAIEHHKDADSAVVAVLDEVMPSMMGSVEVSSVHHEAAVSKFDFFRSLTVNQDARETGSSSSAGPVGISGAHHEPAEFTKDLFRNVSANHTVGETGTSSSAVMLMNGVKSGSDIHVDEANGNVDSAITTDMQENVVGELDVTSSLQLMNGQLDFPSCSLPALNDKQCDLAVQDFLNACNGRSLWSEYIDESLLGKNGNDSINLNVAEVHAHDVDITGPFGESISDAISDAEHQQRTMTLEDFLKSCYSDHSANQVGNGGSLSSEYIVQSLMRKNGSDSINLNVAQVQEQDFDITVPVGDCISQDNPLELPCYHADVDNSFCSKTSTGVPDSVVSPKFLSTEKDTLAPALDFPIPDTQESFVGSGGVLVHMDNNCADIDYNSEDRVQHGDTFLSSSSELIPDLNSNHFASVASTHSSHSVSIESLEDSIADAKNKKNDLLPSLELVTKMIEDVELLEEKAKVAKRESSISGTSILTKVEELKEMLNHAKEANDMHAGEVFGERSILTTEARELQSRLQRLSDERNSYLVVIEEEYEAAVKEKDEKEASAQALLSEQEKEMNSIVEESRKLQKEAEENLKLKEFLVERGRIVDTLQGEMAVICEDVSQLKQIVDERLSWSKLQRSTMSSLSSSLHSSLHRSASSSDRTTEAVESKDKHTVAEVARPVAEDPDVDGRKVEMLNGCDSEGASSVGEDNSKQRGSNEDGWELC